MSSHTPVPTHVRPVIKAFRDGTIFTLIPCRSDGSLLESDPSAPTARRWAYEILPPDGNEHSRLGSLYVGGPDTELLSYFTKCIKESDLIKQTTCKVYDKPTFLRYAFGQGQDVSARDPWQMSLATSSQVSAGTGGDSKSTVDGQGSDGAPQ